MNNIFSGINKDFLILLLTFLTVIFGFLSIRRQILTILTSIHFVPFSIAFSKINYPLKAIIRKPNPKRTFSDQKLNKNVFHSPDIYTIDFISKVDTPVKISPEILIKVIKIDEIDDLPVILLKEPRPYGAGGGGGGDTYDYFSVKLSPEIKVFKAKQTISNFDFFILPIDKPQSFCINVEYTPGFYYWYKIGINYSIGNNKHTFWINKENFGGNPKVMRLWYFRDGISEDSPLIKTNQLFMENAQYLESQPSYPDSHPITPEEYSERYSYGK